MPRLGSATGVGVALETDDDLHIAEMRNELLAENVHDAADLSVIEIQILYDALVNGKHATIDGIERVKFPLLPSDTLDNNDGFSRVVPFEFSIGDHYIQASELLDHDAGGILRIFAELLTPT